jgi:two-component system LytT family response regulator
LIPEKFTSDLIYVGIDEVTRKSVEEHFPFNKFENPKWLFTTDKFPDFEYLIRLYDEVLIVDIHSVEFPKFTRGEIKKLFRLKIILISACLPSKLPRIHGVLSWVTGPFTKDKWGQAISQLNFFLPTKMEMDQLDPENNSSLFVILQNLEDDLDRKVSIADANGVKIVNLDKILYCYSDQSYSHIILENLPTVLSSKSLKYYEELLGGPNFFRAHNQYLINLQHIESYRAAEGVIRMEDGTEIKLSTRKKREFIHYMVQA